MTGDNLPAVLDSIFEDDKRPSIISVLPIKLRSPLDFLPGYLSEEGEVAILQTREKIECCVIYFKSELYFLITPQEEIVQQYLVFNPIFGYRVENQSNFDEMFENKGYMIWNMIPDRFKNNYDGNPEIRIYFDKIQSGMVIFAEPLDFYAYKAYKSHPEVFMQAVISDNKNAVGKLANFMIETRLL